MSHRTTRAPTEAHSLPATVLTASAAVVAVLAIVTTASAPATAVTVAATVITVLVVLRDHSATAGLRDAGPSDAIGTSRHAD